MRAPESRSETVPEAAKDDTPEVTFADLMRMIMMINHRIDMLWQRVLYVHAAIVGVLVFFANADDLYVLQRLLVVFFYSINAVITQYSFGDSFRGLCAVVEDLRRFPDHHPAARAQHWLVSVDYRGHARRRAGFLLLVWAMIVYLLIAPVVSGYLPLS